MTFEKIFERRTGETNRFGERAERAEYAGATSLALACQRQGDARKLDILITSASLRATQFSTGPENTGADCCQRRSIGDGFAQNQVGLARVDHTRWPQPNRRVRIGLGMGHAWFVTHF